LAKKDFVKRRREMITFKLSQEIINRVTEIIESKKDELPFETENSHINPIIEEEKFYFLCILENWNQIGKNKKFTIEEAKKELKERTDILHKYFTIEKKEDRIKYRFHLEEIEKEIISLIFGEKTILLTPLSCERQIWIS
jgi:hypothetical protein